MMTIASIAEKNEQTIDYCRKTESQKRGGGGVGRSRFSFWKHENIERFARRQVPVLAKRGRGLIIDMHAGDGLETPHPQKDMWSSGALITTPHLAVSIASKYSADVWLCEKGRVAHKTLKSGYGQVARIMRNNGNLLKEVTSISAYSWVLVLNDPNGHGKEAVRVDVMEAISTANPVSDFICVVNDMSLSRVCGLDPNKEYPDPLVTAAARTGPAVKWMRDPEQWARRLNKRQWLATEQRRLSPDMRAFVVLVSNWIAGYGR